MMTPLKVYLEIDSDGRCMAHAPQLPGFFIRRAGREQALAALPDAYQAYRAWLEEKGLLDAAPEKADLEVAETHEAAGAFDWGDTAALLSSDLSPLPEHEISRHLAVAAASRGELLDLVQDLPDDVLDWRPDENELSIRRLLIHVGRAEQWYLARLQDPYEALPADADSDVLPTLKFLALSRERVVSGFAALTPSQRKALFRPEHDTSSPGEPWTARKALRRLLEHEREHLQQLRSMLDLWRVHYLALLAAERSLLFWRLVARREDKLTGPTVFDQYTARDVLAHIAAWDDFNTNRILLAAAGRLEEIISVDMDAENAALLAQHRTWSVDEAVAACLSARTRFLTAIDDLPDSLFHQKVTLPWGDERSVREWSRWRYLHDAAHGEELAVWWTATRERGQTGPRSVLMAILDTGREEMTTTAALVPETERETRPVCGVWTLKDVLGHVADWEWYGVEHLWPAGHGETSGRSLAIDYPGTIQEWNDLHAAARQNHSWEQVWDDFQGARKALRTILQNMNQAELEKPFSSPWNPKGDVYRWFALWLHHERSHAADLRRELAIPGFPDRLFSFT